MAKIEFLTVNHIAKEMSYLEAMRKNEFQGVFDWPIQAQNLLNPSQVAPYKAYQGLGTGSKVIPATLPKPSQSIPWFEDNDNWMMDLRSIRRESHLFGRKSLWKSWSTYKIDKIRWVSLGKLGTFGILTKNKVIWHQYCRKWWLDRGDMTLWRQQILRRFKAH